MIRWLFLWWYRHTFRLAEATPEQRFIVLAINKPQKRERLQ